MMLNPVQICMDSSDWPQSMMQERGFRTAAASTEDLLSCSRPLIERGLKPPPEQALKCPRCDSTNTKFCYYNNYSLSQPRHFCKTCRRYWTKGGALRTVPVGGGCRKNKKAKRTVVDQTGFSQNETSTSVAQSSANALSNHNPATNSSSNIFSDINAAAFARAQQEAAARYRDQSGLPNCNGSDFLGLSCGPSGTQSTFGSPTLNPISSLTNLTALSALQSLKSSFPGLPDFPVIGKTSDQASSSLVPPSDWQLPSETALLDTNINFWTAGSWPDLTTYGSSSM